MCGPSLVFPREALSDAALNGLLDELPEGGVPAVFPILGVGDRVEDLSLKLNVLGFLEPAACHVHELDSLWDRGVGEQRDRLLDVARRFGRVDFPLAEREAGRAPDTS